MHAHGSDVLGVRLFKRVEPTRLIEDMLGGVGPISTELNGLNELGVLLQAQVLGGCFFLFGSSSAIPARVLRPAVADAGVFLRVHIGHPRSRDVGDIVRMQKQVAGVQVLVTHHHLLRNVTSSVNLREEMSCLSYRRSNLSTLRVQSGGLCCHGSGLLLESYGSSRVDAALLLVVAGWLVADTWRWVLIRQLLPIGDIHELLVGSRPVLFVLSLLGE
mmetsp:Transcript_35433/g.54211  ORF Transcript_35433/g.54211 Transcript_35433/m.54211 type:complete len:217 (-) Transcript_35433:2425-3075(-)